VYRRSDPAPPIIIGGFGPRMAAIAGKYGDGFNTQARHPNLAELSRIARAEHRTAGGNPVRFDLSVFAGLAPAWLRPDSENRAALQRMGVDRLILPNDPPYDATQIRGAGRVLSG